MSSAPNWIDATFGSFRGFVRLALAHVQALGFRAPDPRPIKRIVFLCHGNICRSPFAEIVAREAGLATASFGLSTTTGAAAHPPVIAIATDLGRDLTTHRATNVADFTPQPGDLLVAMEPRQMGKLARDPKLRDVPRVLLGQGTAFPHLHDPYNLNAAYVRNCLVRIERAVSRLARRYPGARAS